MSVHHRHIGHLMSYLATMRLLIDNLSNYPKMDKARERVRNAQQKYHRSFLEELHLIERYKPSGYEAFRFFRHFVRTTLWPPLHNRTEVQRYQDHFRNTKSRRKKQKTKNPPVGIE